MSGREEWRTRGDDLKTSLADFVSFLSHLRPWIKSTAGSRAIGDMPGCATDQASEIQSVNTSASIRTHKTGSAAESPTPEVAMGLLLCHHNLEEEIERHISGGVHGVQKLHELVTDLRRGLVLYPVAHIVEFETPDQTGKAGAERKVRSCRTRL